MQNHLGARENASWPPARRVNNTRCFHLRYLELCRAKNITPQVAPRNKKNQPNVLDFYGDKLNVTDWNLLNEALINDQVLQMLSIKMRKTSSSVFENIDTERKAKLFKQKPVIFSKFVFSAVVEAACNCIEHNKNLCILKLEGLPLNNKYVEFVAKAIASNESLKEISFQRSRLNDKACETICNSIKYMQNLEMLNLSECELTSQSAEHIADMIKIQKITRYTEGWQQSLRYRGNQTLKLSGLHSILMARNPDIADKGLESILEILKEDCWIKVVDMEQCGITDAGAKSVLDCLKMNSCITDFPLKGNAISKVTKAKIDTQLGKDEDGFDMQEKAARKPKETVKSLKEDLKAAEDQIQREKKLRKEAELLNDVLSKELQAIENRMINGVQATIPNGYVVVNCATLESVIEERNELKIMVAAMKHQFGQFIDSEDNSQPQFDEKLQFVEKPQFVEKTQYVERPQFDEKPQFYEQPLQQQQQNEIEINTAHTSARTTARTTAHTTARTTASTTSRTTASTVSSIYTNIATPKSSVRSRKEAAANAYYYAPATPTAQETVQIPPHIELPILFEIDKEPTAFKVRQVRSEIKYVEQAAKDVGKKKESKSDHELANETDYRLPTVRFETHIGDSVQIVPQPVETPQIDIEKLDKISISSYQPDSSTDSESTLRYEKAMTPMSVFFRRSQRSAKQQTSAKQQISAKQQKSAKQQTPKYAGQAKDNHDATPKFATPRSVFFGNRGE